jgi:hypothetical protein
MCSNNTVSSVTEELLLELNELNSTEEDDELEVNELNSKLELLEELKLVLLVLKLIVLELLVENCSVELLLLLNPLFSIEELLSSQFVCGCVGTV